MTAPNLFGPAGLCAPAALCVLVPGAVVFETSVFLVAIKGGTFWVGLPNLDLATPLTPGLVDEEPGDAEPMEGLLAAVNCVSLTAFLG